jgi:hypothetical protein
MTQQQQEQIILDKLSKHPEIRTRFLEILRVLEDDQKELNSPDAVEEYLIEEVQKLGLEVLQEWSIEKANQLAADVKNKPGVTKHSKKNSSGILHSEN